MRSIAISIVLLGYIVTMSKCEQAYETNALDMDGMGTDIDKDSFLKRMERRAYTYMTGLPGNKRLPNYNFGLGKRASRPYRFGLGKRSDDTMDYDDAAYLADQQQNWRPWFDRETRSRYAMGLGKRMNQNENVERRSPPQERLYGFGLGKRAAPIEENSSTPLPIDQQNYDGYDRIGVSRGALSVGLGKRLLQQENVERRSGVQRYNFGLGR